MLRKVNGMSASGSIADIAGRILIGQTSTSYVISRQMSEAARLREDAVKCRRQAEIATDLLTMTRLTMLANEYDAKAKKIEDAIILPKR